MRANRFGLLAVIVGEMFFVGCTSTREASFPIQKISSVNNKQVAIVRATRAGTGCPDPDQEALTLELFSPKPDCEDLCSMNCVETHPMEMLMFHFHHGPKDTVPRTVELSPAEHSWCYSSGSEPCGARVKVEIRSLATGHDVEGAYETIAADGKLRNKSFHAKWCGGIWSERLDCPQSKSSRSPPAR